MTSYMGQMLDANAEDAAKSQSFNLYEASSETSTLPAFLNMLVQLSSS